VTQERANEIHEKYTNYSGREWNFTEILQVASKKNVNDFIIQCYYWHNFPESMECNSEAAFVHSYTSYGSCLTFNHFRGHFKANPAEYSGIGNGLSLLIDLDPHEITGK
jgi:hypothetical protein